MCHFFSCISDGKGKTLFFKPEHIAEEMSKGNPEQYEWNSHSSMSSYFKIDSNKEHNWNKWEYDVNKKVLNEDRLNTTDDSKKVKNIVERYSKNKDVQFLQNFYGNNSGDMNSGNGIFGSFCSKEHYSLFNVPCTKKQYIKVYSFSYSWFILTQWINEQDMTTKEKKNYPSFYVTKGYLKTYSYKEAWSKCPKEVLTQIKQLHNFNAKVFEEITGITI